MGILCTGGKVLRSFPSGSQSADRRACSRTRDLVCENPKSHARTRRGPWPGGGGGGGVKIPSRPRAFSGGRRWIFSSPPPPKGPQSSDSLTKKMGKVYVRTPAPPFVLNYTYKKSSGPGTAPLNHGTMSHWGSQGAPGEECAFLSQRQPAAWPTGRRVWGLRRRGGVVEGRGFQPHPAVACVSSCPLVLPLISTLSVRPPVRLWLGPVASL
ncbi:hypothetical protein SKAU_G00185160 [Synaphobranchus kaupii]|uniref:Uncharacterized protein n=1 Tax=Synaphobranchus kaupii TaxID=118154 RepID=A0A9Q1FCH7_SYNKA|nr:hypothetical protein SKAU_G00185160 [Synaphobranchus kaupii]